MCKVKRVKLLTLTEIGVYDGVIGKEEEKEELKLTINKYKKIKVFLKECIEVFFFCIFIFIIDFAP